MQIEKRHFIWASIILLIISVFSSINSIGLRAEEPRRAVTGFEVYESGNLIVPQIHGQPYYNKPPLYSYLIAATYYITGSFNEWAVRLPGILSFLLTGLLAFWIARKYSDTDTAFLAAFGYLTSVDLLFYASVNAGQIDLFYTFISLAQVVSIFYFYQKRQFNIMYITSYILAALGTLTKGMPSIAIQIITIAAYLAYYKDWKTYFSKKHITGILLFIIIIGGYFFLYSQQENVIGFIENLYKESSKRTISDMPFFSSLATIVTFPGQIFTILLPWSVLVIYMFRKNIKATIRSNPYVVFSVIFVLTNIIIYWFSPRFKNRYAYIFVPSFTFLLAYFYTSFRNTEIKKTRFIETFWLCVIALVGIASLATPFVDIFKNNVKHVTVYAISFSIIAALIFWLYYKQKENRMYVFILFIITCRIGYNFLIIPIEDKNSDATVYKIHVNKMLQIAKGEPIYYTGELYKIVPDVSFFNLELTKTTIYTPPLIPYEIPYYLSLQTKTILPYTDKTEKGKLYLVHMKYLKDFHIDILYSFIDTWDYDKRMILYRKK